MNITVNVIGQKMTTNYKKIIEGSQKFVRFHFNLSDEWRGLIIGVQFIPDNGQPITDYLDNENCVYLPPQISEGTFTMSLRGTGDISKQDVIGTSNSLTFEVGEFIYSDEADSPEITPVEVFMAAKNYDPQGKRTDIFKYVDDQVELVKSDLDEVQEEVDDARKLDDEVIMDKVGDSLRYVYNLAKNNQGSLVQSPIAIVSELPQNATNGDMCIVSLPNTLDIGVDRFIYIDWEQLLGVSMNYMMGITTDEEFDDTIFPNNTVGFDMGFSDPVDSSKYLMVSIASTPKELTNSGSHELAFYYENFKEGDGNSTGLELCFRDGVLVRTIEGDRPKSNRFDYVNGEFLRYEVDSLPTRFDISSWLDHHELDDVVKWFYSPYKLMIYRNGWERI